MLETEILVIGGGPAGLMAALSAAEQGARVLLAERDPGLGGQLLKQTHMFFGSKEQYAAERGFKIARILNEQVKNNNQIEVFTGTTALGYYDDHSVCLEKEGAVIPVSHQALVVATGAQENTMVFPGSDLPGIYGAGAVQTLMNMHGVLPGKKVVMVGAGNIGVIVSYQLLQAGVQVLAIIEAQPQIGAYHVHAAKIRRMGAPIYTGHTVTRATGKDCLEKVTVMALEKGKPVSGSEKEFAVDVLCVSVGLTPLTELLFQAGCQMIYSAELGGHVPKRHENLETTVPNVFVSGDAASIEEASAAMVEGRLAGLSAASNLGHRAGYEEKFSLAQEQLHNLRRGPVGEKIRSGLARLQDAGEVV